MRVGFILAAGAGACLLLAWRPAPPALMWNTTKSVPVGLYALSPPDRVAVGDLVAIRPPGGVALLLADRGWLPMGVPLLKPVVALENQVVCRTGDVVQVDGVASAVARRRDRLGRALPVWTGCRQLGVNDVFVLSAAEGDSFDGRYFGPLARTTVLTRATPLWLWPTRHETGARR